MLSYLTQKNYSAIAMSLAKEEKTKFQLALKCGNLQAAYESANKLQDKACFEKLAKEALIQGCSPLVEIGYQESEKWQSLAFLHLATGNLQGLEELRDHARETKDHMTNFNVSLYKGDIEARVKTLAEIGQCN